jgi:hypothetical protein
LRDGQDGRLLVNCWGGCDRHYLLAELRRIGLLNPGKYDNRSRAPAHTSAVHSTNDATRLARALAIWSEAGPMGRTICEAYWRSRAISLDSWPNCLRFHPSCPHPSGTRLPAMVALVVHTDHGPVAIHRTYLRMDGAGKAVVKPDRAMLGRVGGAAVLFGKARAGDWFVVGEGIETTLSVVTACGLPGSAALSAEGIRQLILPRDARQVVICADNDGHGRGQCAARDAAQRFLVEGRRVRIASPTVIDSDFNDMLMAGRVCRSGVLGHVTA